MKHFLAIYIYNESNNPTTMSNILGNVEFQPTIIWASRDSNDDLDKLTRYERVKDITMNAGFDGKFYLTDNSQNNVKASYNGDNGSTDYKDTDITYDIIQNYVKLLNENPFNNIDVFKNLYFKLQLQVPVTNMSLETFITIAKYINGVASTQTGHPQIMLIEHNMDIQNAIAIGVKNNTLAEPTDELTVSNATNKYKIYDTNKHLVTKETFRLNMVDVIVLSLFYNQLSENSKLNNNVRIGENEFYAIVEMIIPTLAYKNIYVDMNFIHHKLKEWKDNYKNTYDKELFPISLQQYVKLIHTIIYNSYFVYWYLDSLKTDATKMPNTHTNYLEKEIQHVKTEIENTMDGNNKPSGPFDIRYYYNAFLQNERYPEWRICNIPTSIRYLLGLTPEKINNINKNNNEDMIHILWRIDFIWNLRKDSSSNDADGFDISGNSDTLFKTYFDNIDAYKKYEDGTVIPTHKEAFLYKLFDVSMLNPDDIKPIAMKLSDQNYIYRQIRDEPGKYFRDDTTRKNTSNNVWMYQLCLDNLFDDNIWKWPFNVHIFDFAPLEVLKTEYSFVLKRLTDISSVGVQHPQIHYSEIKELDTSLNAISNIETYNSYKQLFDEYSSVDSQYDISENSIYHLKRSEYDGFFYNNETFLNVIRQKVYSDSDFNFVSDTEYNNDRNKLLTNLTELLDDWIDQQNA